MRCTSPVLLMPRPGLLWAARGSFLNAASLATNDYHKYRKLTRRQVGLRYERLKWIEVELGRLPQALEWYELATCWCKSLRAKRSRSPAPSLFDAIVGILFLEGRRWVSLRSLRAPAGHAWRSWAFLWRGLLCFTRSGHAHELPKEVLGERGTGSRSVLHESGAISRRASEIRALSLGAGDTTHARIGHAGLPCYCRSR